METTVERPPPSSGGFRNAADLQFAGRRLNWPISAIESTPLCIARRSVKGALHGTRFQALAASCSTAQKPGRGSPSQAGTSCKAGASTARTQDGQPSPPKRHPTGHHGPDGGGGVYAGVIPAVPAPHPIRPRRPSDIPPALATALHPSGRRDHWPPPDRLRFRRQLKRQPVSLSESKAAPVAVAVPQSPSGRSRTPPTQEVRAYSFWTWIGHPRTGVLCTL